MYFEDEEIDQYEGEMAEDDELKPPGQNANVLQDIEILK